MAVRTTSDKVKAVLAPGGDYDTVNAPDLTPFIDSAASIVDDVATCATKRSKTLSSAKLELIERWLAAHMYCQSDQQYQSKRTQKSSGSFRGKTEMGLDSTLYGQHAKVLDTSGCLSALSKGATAGIRWLGKTKTERQTFKERN